MHINIIVISQCCYMQNPSRRFRSGQNQSATREKSALRGQRVAKTYESALVLPYDLDKRTVPAVNPTVTKNIDIFIYVYDNYTNE